jgi:hypothetical protein
MAAADIIHGAVAVLLGGYPLCQNSRHRQRLQRHRCCSIGCHRAQLTWQQAGSVPCRLIQEILTKGRDSWGSRTACCCFCCCILTTIGCLRDVLHKAGASRHARQAAQQQLPSLLLIWCLNRHLMREATAQRGRQLVHTCCAGHKHNWCGEKLRDGESVPDPAAVIAAAFKVAIMTVATTNAAAAAAVQGVCMGFYAACQHAAQSRCI